MWLKNDILTLWSRILKSTWSKCSSCVLKLTWTKWCRWRKTSKLLIKSRMLFVHSNKNGRTTIQRLLLLLTTKSMKILTLWLKNLNVTIVIKQVTKLSLTSTNMFLIKIFQTESFEKKRARKKNKIVRTWAVWRFEDLVFKWRRWWRAEWKVNWKWTNFCWIDAQVRWRNA